MNKIINILLIILFFLLPLINSHLLNLFWIDIWLYVEWNYEYTKVMFFNILSWLIFILFFINNVKKNYKIKIPLLIFPLIFIAFLSSILSEQIYTSFFWNNSKWHSFIMYINLIWLFLVLLNTKNNILKKIIFSIIFSSFLVWLIWIKEYFFPTFDYWELSNRALSTFWHPNYLALYLIITIPLIIKNLRNKNNIYFKIFLLFTLIISIFCLFLTKSVWWIFIFINYLFILCYYLLKKLYNKNYLKYILLLMCIILIIILLFTTINFFPEKLQSFISRYYIWKTTLIINFSDIKTFLIWWWLWTLENVFDIYKVKELYIFENFWFTADRPHNILLYYFYIFWFFWLIFIVYIFYYIIKKYKNKYNYNILIIFFVFCFLNFPWITHYIILLLLWTFIIKENWIKTIKNIYIYYFIYLFIWIIWFIWIYFSTIYYIQEYSNKNNLNIINSKIIENIKKENYVKYIIKNSKENKEILCEKIINNKNTAENYIYCWNILWFYNKNLAINYYKKWLEKLPNMWDENSKYYDNFLIKKLFITERFFSEKYNNLNEILDRIN